MEDEGLTIFRVRFTNGQQYDDAVFKIIFCVLVLQGR